MNILFLKYIKLYSKNKFFKLYSFFNLNKFTLNLNFLEHEKIILEKYPTK